MLDLFPLEHYYLQDWIQCMADVLNCKAVVNVHSLSLRESHLNVPLVVWKHASVKLLLLAFNILLLLRLAFLSLINAGGLCSYLVGASNKHTHRKSQGWITLNYKEAFFEFETGAPRNLSNEQVKSSLEESPSMSEAFGNEPKWNIINRCFNETIWRDDGD